MKKATTTEGAARPAARAPAKRASRSAASAPRKTAGAVPAAAGNHMTAVVARIDVGFGNRLYIRGDGPGLSWDRGTVMQCIGSDQWNWSTTSATRPFAYKLLVNDDRWSIGDDLVANVGIQNTVSPAF